MPRGLPFKSQMVATEGMVGMEEQDSPNGRVAAGARAHTAFSATQNRNAGQMGELVALALETLVLEARAVTAVAAAMVEQGLAGLAGRVSRFMSTVSRY